MKKAAGFTILVLVTLFALPSRGPASGQEGPAHPESNCAKCHAGPQATWQASAHARAGDALRGAERSNPECLGCHAPQNDPAKGVGCVSCHGSGFECGDWNAAVAAGRHLSAERSCLACHRPSRAHPDSRFSFSVDFPEVAHPRAKKPDLYSADGVYRRWKTYGPADGLPHHKVFAVKVAGSDVWAGTEDGVALLRDGKWRSWGTKDGLVHQAVTSIDVDRKTGEVFLGTLGGVSVFDGTRFTNFVKADKGLCNNCVFGVSLLGDDLWVATFDGISRYNRRTQEWKTYYLNNAPLDEVWIYGCEATPDKMNFAVWGGGLVEYQPDRDHWEAYHDPDGSFELDLFKDDGITSLMSTGVSYDNGNDWVSSYFGVSRYDGRDWHEYNQDDSGLASNFVNFTKARRFEGFQCTDKGLSVLDVARGRWVNYRRLEGSRPETMIEITDTEGRHARRFAGADPFPYDFVWQVDFQGDDVWVATSNGIARGSYGTSEDRLSPIDDPERPFDEEAAALEATAAPAPEPGQPVGVVARELFGKGFAQTVLGPEYTQPYVHFQKPHAVPLAIPFSEFVDPIGREDTSFEDAPTVKLGFLGCLSGPAKSYSEEMLRGAQLALGEINAAGGYHGKPVELAIRDDKATMGLTAHQTVKLIYDDKVLAFLGSMSSDTTHVALRVALKCEVAELTSISTDPTITQVVIPWVFRCLADDWSQSRALAKLLFLDRKFKKIALLERNNRYGRMGSAEIKRVAKRMGHPITLAIRYGARTKSFAEHIKRIRDYGADGVVIWGLYADSAQIVREMREAGLDLPVFGADGLVSQKFIDMAGPAAEGVVVTYPYNAYRRDPLTQDFNRRFLEKYGHEPDSFAAHGYDAMYVLWKAVQRGGLNRTRIRDALAQTHDFHGVTGMISFDHRNNDMRGVEFAVVHDGKFLPLSMAGEHVIKGRHEK